MAPLNCAISTTPCLVKLSCFYPLSYIIWCLISQFSLPWRQGFSLRKISVTPLICAQARKLPVFCNIHGSIKVKVKGPLSLLMVPHLRATGRHLPYGITQCYLPPVMMGNISFFVCPMLCIAALDRIQNHLPCPVSNVWCLVSDVRCPTHFCVCVRARSRSL